MSDLLASRGRYDRARCAGFGRCRVWRCDRRVICKIEGRNCSGIKYSRRGWCKRAAGPRQTPADNVNCVEISQRRSQRRGCTFIALSAKLESRLDAERKGGNLLSPLRYHFRHVCDRVPYTSEHGYLPGYVHTYASRIMERRRKCIRFYLSPRPRATSHNESPVNLFPPPFASRAFPYAFSRSLSPFLPSFYLSSAIPVANF